MVYSKDHLAVHCLNVNAVDEFLSLVDIHVLESDLIWNVPRVHTRIMRHVYIASHLRSTSLVDEFLEVVVDFGVNHFLS